MIHRRLLVDDWRGVGEPLNETEKDGTIGLRARMKHYLVFGNMSDERYRDLQYTLDTAPIVVLANETLAEFLSSPSLKQRSLNLDTFEIEKGLKIYLRDFDQDNDLYLLRVFNNDESKAKNFNLNYEYQERSLNVVMTKEEMEKKKLKWPVETKKSQSSPVSFYEAVVTDSKRNLSISHFYYFRLLIFFSF